MSVFIAQIILVLSLGGVFFIVVRKIPVLAALPTAIPVKKSHSKGELLKKVKTSASSIKQRVPKLEALRNGGLKEVVKTEKKEEVELDADYWDKVTGR